MCLFPHIDIENVLYMIYGGIHLHVFIFIKKNWTLNDQLCLTPARSRQPLRRVDGLED